MSQCLASFDSEVDEIISFLGVVRDVWEKAEWRKRTIQDRYGWIAGRNG